MIQPTIIGVLGKPLSGKDTVAHALMDEHPDTTTTISISAVISDVKKMGEAHRFWPILKDAISIAEAGGIVPGEPVNQCMEYLINEALAGGKTNIIWIAGPRNIEELEWLDGWAPKRHIATKYLHVDLSDEEALRRLDGRKLGRLDDRADILKIRLDNFRDITKPVIDTLRQEGRLIEINGEGTVNDVRERLHDALHLRPYDPEITLPAMARR